MNNGVYKWDNNIEAVELDGSWVIMHAEKNTVTKLNEMGGWLWSLLQEPHTSDDLVESILSEYDVSKDKAQADVHTFLGQLLEKKIISMAEHVHE